MVTKMGLTLPEETDFYNIQVFNNNFNRLESVLSSTQTTLTKTVRNTDILADEVNMVDTRVTASKERIDELARKCDLFSRQLSFANTSIFSLVKYSGHQSMASDLGVVAVKNVTIPGFKYVDGAIVAVFFIHDNTHAAPQLNVRDGNESLGAKQMWNDKGQIGTANNNNIIAGPPGKLHIFQYDSATDRFIWLMNMSQ